MQKIQPQRILKSFYRFPLYTDNFIRFEVKQFLYLFVNRIIKPHLPIIILKNKENSLNFNDTKINTNLFLGFIKNWEFPENSTIRQGTYFRKFVNNILEKKPYHQLTRYDFDKLDDEINNNLYRFHLMSEIANELKMTSAEKIQLIVEWIDNIPVSRNNIWNGFNTSMRLINWIKLLHSLDEDFQPDLNNWKVIVNSVSLHLKIIKYNIEHHVPGNHVLIQYFSLWLAYNIFSDLRNSKKYRVWSLKKLSKEVDKEFFEDGLHFEFSFHYHVQATLFCLIWLYGLLLAEKQLDFELRSKIEKAADLIPKFLFPDETIPMIGDGCYTFLNSSLKEDIKMCKLLVASIFGYKKHTMWLDQKTIHTKSYVISNSGNSKVIFDVGNIGYKSNPGHGHSDLLSIIYYNKELLFIDPGTKTYNKETESLLQKKTVSHNTLSIDGKDQAFFWDFFRWSYLPTDIKQEIQNNKDIVLIGEFNGFNAKRQFKHKREIVLGKTNIKIKDSVLGSNFHQILINFILAPSITFTENDGKILLRGKENNWQMGIYSESKYTLSKSNINIYPSYNLPVPSYKLTFSFNSVELPFNSEFEIILT